MDYTVLTRFNGPTETETDLHMRLVTGTRLKRLKEKLRLSLDLKALVESDSLVPAGRLFQRKQEPCSFLSFQL